MSNRLEHLQGECKKYYLKKSLKVILTLIAIVILAFSGYYFSRQDSLQSPSVTPVHAPSKIVDYTLNVSNDDVAKAVQNMKTQSVVKNKPIVKVQQKKKVKTMLKTVPKERFFSNISEDRSLDGWIEKYNQKKSYSIAIYISKQYYFKSEYKDAGIWAKRANQLDRNKEEAWLFYAKSVYALGDVQKAKRILNILLQYKESTKAELLLSEWSRKGN